MSTSATKERLAPQTEIPQAERIRLNLVVNPQVKARIERLQKLSEGSSLTEVIRRALAVYEEILKIREEGADLIVESSDGQKILKII